MILKTRLFKPPVSQNFTFRKSLINEMLRHHDKSVQMIIAAAGYGKSTLASQYLDNCNQTFCWLSLDIDSNDSKTVLTYLVEAIQTSIPKSMESTTQILSAIDLPSTKAIINCLINDLTEIKSELTITLDDYHVIKNKIVHSIFESLLTNLPPSIKILLISRIDPPLKLARLKAYNQLFELRMGNLKFSSNEILHLAKSSHQLDINIEEAKKIEIESEGWIIAVRLILNKIKNGNESNLSKRGLDKEKNVLVEYMLKELLESLSFNLQRCLMVSSLFRRFSIPLLCHVMSEFLKDVDRKQLENEMLAILENSMFVIPLDENRTWFRFHHIVIDFLNNNIVRFLSLEQQNIILNNASIFFNKDKSYEEAIEMAVKAENISFAIDIINDHKENLLYNDKEDILKRWLQIIPKVDIYNSIDALLIKAIIHDSHIEYDDLHLTLDRTHSLLNKTKLNEESRIHWGGFYSIKSYFDYQKGDIENALIHAEKSLKFLDKHQIYLRDRAVLVKGLGLHMSNQPEEAKLFFKNFIHSISVSSTLTSMRVHGYFSLLKIYQANLKELEYSAKLIHDISVTFDSRFSQVMSNCFMAYSNYMQNKLQNVIPFVDAIEGMWYNGRPLWVVHTVIAKIMCQISLNNFKEAEETLNRLTDFLSSFENGNLTKWTWVIKTEIAVRKNDLKQAKEMAKMANFELHPIIFSFYFSQLTEVKFLLLSGTQQDLQEAHHLLEKYLLIGEETNHRTFLIQAYLLMSVCQQKENNLDSALQYVQKAINLGRHSNYIRPFVDLGADIQVLIKKLSLTKKGDFYIKEILKAFLNDKNSSITKKLSEVQTFYDVNLTSKELKILNLIAKGYQNKEIANELHYSLGTVKSYIYKIYQRIDVKNRAQAIQVLEKKQIKSPLV